MTSRSDQSLQSARERTSHVGSVGCKRVGDTRARMRTRQWMRVTQGGWIEGGRGCARMTQAPDQTPQVHRCDGEKSAVWRCLISAKRAASRCLTPRQAPLADIQQHGQHQQVVHAPSPLSQLHAQVRPRRKKQPVLQLHSHQARYDAHVQRAIGQPLQVSASLLSTRNSLEHTAGVKRDLCRHAAGHKAMLT